MIGASRRRSAPAATEPFRLHQRLSRRAAWQRRLLHASLAALAVAAVTLFLPLDLAGRVGLVALGAVAGLAWPLRSREPAALRSIREQTGLSYETALTVLERAGTGARPAEADPYGLERAVVERAQQAVKAYRSEASPPWWLPALLVAAVLVALPVLGPLAGGPSARGGGQAAGGAVSEPSAPEAGEAPEPAAPEPPAPGRAEAPPVEPSEGQRAEAPPVAEPPDGGAGDQAPLSRYLDSLRERPANEGGAPGQTQSPPSRPEQPQEAARGDSPAQPGDGAAQAGAGRPEGDGGEPAGASQDPSQAPAEGDVAASPQGQEGDDGSGGQEAGSEPGAGAGEPGGEEGAGDSLEEGGLEPGQGEGGDGARASGAGGEPGDGSEGSDSAGIGGGSDATAEGFEASGQVGDTELLRGVLQEGPETVAGSVRLPGRDEVELPPGTSYAPYQGAAEEALSEGDLPLDYQEIIRRYFR